MKTKQVILVLILLAISSLTVRMSGFFVESGDQSSPSPLAVSSHSLHIGSTLEELSVAGLKLDNIIGSSTFFQEENFQIGVETRDGTCVDIRCKDIDCITSTARIRLSVGDDGVFVKANLGQPTIVREVRRGCEFIYKMEDCYLIIGLATVVDKAFLGWPLSTRQIVAYFVIRENNNQFPSPSAKN